MGTKKYNPVTDIWSDVPPLPTNQIGHVYVSLDNKIYALGGMDGTNNVEYDNLPFSTGKWYKRADMPTARVNLGAAAVNGTIYVIGGSPRRNRPSVKTVEAFTPEAKLYYLHRKD